MKAWLERYLELTALAAVGGALLDPRPAFVAGDKGGLLWANEAGRALLRLRSMDEIAAESHADGPLSAQIRVLARTLPATGSRLEALCFPLGPVAARCQRIEVADGETAVFAVAEIGAPAAGIASRARQIAVSLGSSGQRAGILDRQGHWVGASEGIEAAERDAVAAAVRDEAGPAERVWPVPGGLAVAFVAEGEPLVLATWEAPPEARDEAVAIAAPRAAKPTESVLSEPAKQISEAVPETVAMTATEPAPSPTRSPPQPPPAAENAAPPPVSERLSGTEADAFRRIREALDRNGRLSPGSVPWQAAPSPAVPQAVAAASAAAPLPDDRTLPATLPPPPAALPFDENLLDRLPLGIVVFRDQRTLFANRAILDVLGLDSVEAFAAGGGVDEMFVEGTPAWSKGDFDDRDGRLAVLPRDREPVPVEARLNMVTWAGETAFLLSVTRRAILPEPEPALEAEPSRPAPAQPAPAVLNPTAAERRIHDLETILNTATDGVIVVDRHGTVESMNRAAEALFAVNAADLKGRSFTELLAEESRKTALDYLDGLAANGVQSVLNDGREVIGAVPNGGLIPLSMTMGRLGDSGRFSAVMRDITHWKTVEEELTAARREAEAANAQKSEFLAKISHEIRTPLNAIIGFSEIMMEQRFGPIGNDRYRSYLSDIHVSGAHLMSLINDLLDLSKIEAGKVELTFEAVAVNTVIQETVALMQPLANRERIIIRTSLGGELPSVVADQRSFRQILLNLLSNAIKFTRAGGQVIVSTLLEETGEVVVRIRDTGIGMTAKDIETAMKPFEQVSETQGDRDKGTGLGLPLTKAMVEANRAAFAIESAPNQGTLVRITFPTTRVLAG